MNNRFRNFYKESKFSGTFEEVSNKVLSNICKHYIEKNPREISVIVKLNDTFKENYCFSLNKEMNSEEIFNRASDASLVISFLIYEQMRQFRGAERILNNGRIYEKAKEFSFKDEYLEEKNIFSITLKSK